MRFVTEAGERFERQVANKPFELKDLARQDRVIATCPIRAFVLQTGGIFNIKLADKNFKYFRRDDPAFAKALKAR